MGDLDLTWVTLTLMCVTLTFKCVTVTFTSDLDLYLGDLYHGDNCIYMGDLDLYIHDLNIEIDLLLNNKTLISHDMDDLNVSTKVRLRYFPTPEVVIHQRANTPKNGLTHIYRNAIQIFVARYNT